MIVIASDHAGFKLKQKLIKYFLKNNMAFIDIGAKNFDALDSYVDYAKQAVKYFVENCDVGADKLFLICGSGVGMDIVANRNTSIRSVLAYSARQALEARKHNNANCLCLGARNTCYLKARYIVKKFLKTEFLGGKYQKRLETI